MRFLLPLILLLQTPGASSDKALQETLSTKYARQLLTMRDFPTGTRLQFDADGKLVGGGDPGVFTLDGSVRVDSVSVLPDRVEIRGRHAFLEYNTASQKLEGFLTNDRVRLEFARKQDVAVEPVIDRVLLTFDRLVMVAPPYWSRYLLGKVKPVPVVDPKTGVVVPRASEAQGLIPRNTHQVAPKYPEILKPYNIAGSVLLHLIVNEQGKPFVADLMEPVGFGLDQAAIEAVQQWEYEPARQDGKPVQVYFRVRVNFSAQK
jgi:TonB family protein